MTDEETLEQQIDQAIQALTVYHAGALAAAISTYYRAGSEDSRDEQEAKAKKLSPLQEAAIQKMTAEHFGYMAEFDKAVGEAIKEKAREILRKEGGYKDIKNEIKKYVSDVFEGKETVTINHIGRKKKILKVDKNGKLYEVEKTIEREYVSNVDAYSDMLSRTATHKAFEQGRASEYQRLGFTKFRYTSVCDERSRPSHCALSGQVFEFGTAQADYAMQMLSAPHCRCRILPFFEDPQLDAPKAKYEKFKERKGLYWNDDIEDWAFREPA